jgi:hypothetical protein
VFLSDGKVRNLLGPALEFVFGLKTLVVWPASVSAGASADPGMDGGGHGIIGA